MSDEGGEAPKPGPKVSKRFEIKDSGESKKFVEDELAKARGELVKESGERNPEPKQPEPTKDDLMRSSQWRRDSLDKEGKSGLEPITDEDLGKIIKSDNPRE